jgi:hypothetical protein
LELTSDPLSVKCLEAQFLFWDKTLRLCIKALSPTVLAQIVTFGEAGEVIRVDVQRRALPARQLRQQAERLQLALGCVVRIKSFVGWLPGYGNESLCMERIQLAQEVLTSTRLTARGAPTAAGHVRLVWG